MSFEFTLSAPTITALARPESDIQTMPDIAENPCPAQCSCLNAEQTATEASNRLPCSFSHLGNLPDLIPTSQPNPTSTKGASKWHVI